MRGKFIRFPSYLKSYFCGDVYSGRFAVFMKAVLTVLSGSNKQNKEVMKI